jgi:hypothetical protein
VSNGRNGKIKPMGFDAAATVLTCDFSPEARTNFTTLVRDVARQYDHNDSVALNRLRSRLNRAAGGRNATRRRWAEEVLAKLPKREPLAAGFGR